MSQNKRINLSLIPLAFIFFATVAVSQESSNAIPNKEPKIAKREKVLIPSDTDTVYAFIGIGKIISIDAQRAYDEIMVVQVDDQQIKISNFCFLIKYESSSASIRTNVGDKYDICARLKSFSEFHIGDKVRITSERGFAQIKLEQAGDNPQ